MRLLLDENIEAEVVAALRQAGYEVMWVRDACPGASDEEVLALAQSSGQVVITGDRGFGQWVHLSSG